MFRQLQGFKVFYLGHANTFLNPQGHRTLVFTQDKTSAWHLLRRGKEGRRCRLVYESNCDYPCLYLFEVEGNGARVPLCGALGSIVATLAAGRCVRVCVFCGVGHPTQFGSASTLTMASPPVTDWAEDEVEGFGRSYEEKRSYLLNVAASALRGRNPSTPIDRSASRNAASKRSVAIKGGQGGDGRDSAITSADASERSTSGPQPSDEQANRAAPASNSAAAATTAARAWQSSQTSLQGRGRQGLDEAFGRISMQAASNGSESMSVRAESPAKERERHRKRSEFDPAEAAALNARILGDVGGEADEAGTAPRSSRAHSNRVYRELPSQPPYRAYVGHVPAQVQEDQIRQFFDGCRINRVRLLRRGPAPPSEVTEPAANGHEAATTSLSEESAVRAVFVDFGDAESLAEALKRHGALLDGCAVVVDIAQHAGSSSNTDTAGGWGASSRSRRAHRPQTGLAPERSEMQSSARNRRGGAPATGSRSSASGRYVNGGGSSSTAVHLGRSHKPSRRGWVHIPEAHRGQQSKEQEAKLAPTTTEKPAATVLSRNNFAALASLDSSLSDDEH